MRRRGAYREIPIKNAKYLIIESKDIELGLNPTMDLCLAYYLLYCAREREVVCHRKNDSNSIFIFKNSTEEVIGEAKK
jgi:hypothetical protein